MRESVEIEFLPDQEDWRKVMNILGINALIEVLEAERARLVTVKQPVPVPATVEGVYGKTLEELEPFLQGYLPRVEKSKLVVRLPLRGEWFLTSVLTVERTQVDFAAMEDGPWERLILEPRRQVVLPVIREGEPRPGDTYFNPGYGRVVFAPTSCTGVSAFILGRPKLEDC